MRIIRLLFYYFISPYEIFACLISRVGRMPDIIIGALYVSLTHFVDVPFIIITTLSGWSIRIWLDFLNGLRNNGWLFLVEIENGLRIDRVHPDEFESQN